MDQLVTEVFIDLVRIVELVGSHESAGQLGSEYQPRLFGLLDLNNAHELARFGSRILAFGSHNLIFLWQSIAPAMLLHQILQILPAAPVWIKVNGATLVSRVPECGWLLPASVPYHLLHRAARYNHRVPAARGQKKLESGQMTATRVRVTQIIQDRGIDCGVKTCNQRVTESTT